MAEQVDAVVIGLGVGGEEVAGSLAEAGLHVVAVEANLVGGVCPYWGCIPSKMMIRAANLVAETRRVEGMAGRATVAPSWEPVARRIRDEATADWDDTAAADRLTNKGGRVVRGWGRLDGPGRVVVDGTAFDATRAVVLATGQVPVVPPVDGLADTPYWTNRQAIEAAELPESLLVLGGGAVGMELAQVYRRFGVAVTVVEASERLLSFEEPEASELVYQALKTEGFTIHTGVGAQRVEYGGGEFRLTLADGKVVTGQRLLVSTGRRADLARLGLETVGLDPASRSIEVDGQLRVVGADQGDGPGLWAVGDVAGRGAFTHVSMYQARIAVRDILGEPGPPADYRALPRVTFTDPEVGSVGLTEARARDAGLRVATGSVQLPSVTRGWIHKAGNAGFIKLVADADRRVLVGATSAGPAGGEVLSMLALAVQAEVPVDTLRHMMYAFPTFHRGIEPALQDLAL